MQLQLHGGGVVFHHTSNVFPSERSKACSVEGRDMQEAMRRTPFRGEAVPSCHKWTEQILFG